MWLGQPIDKASQGQPVVKPVGTDGAQDRIGHRWHLSHADGKKCPADKLLRSVLHFAGTRELLAQMCCGLLQEVPIRL